MLYLTTQELGHQQVEHRPLRPVQAGDGDLSPHRGRPLGQAQRGPAEATVPTAAAVPQRFVHELE